MYKAKLHSPVDKISMIKDKLQSREVHYADGILFLSSKKGPIKVMEFEQHAISAKLYGKRKNDLVELAS